MPPKKTKSAPKPDKADKSEPEKRDTRSKTKDKEEQKQISKVKPKTNIAKDQPKPIKKTKKEELPQKQVKKSQNKQKQEKSKDKINSKQSKKGDKNVVKSKQQTKSEPLKQKDQEEDQKKDELKKVIMKGKAPVDQYFSKPTLFRVYTDKEGIYSSTLNQSNIEANNNKFYIIQLLQQEGNHGNFMLFTRWGRVGVQGQSSQQGFKLAQSGIRQYRKKLNQKLKKSYRLVEMNYQQNAEQVKDQKDTNTKVESTLDIKVQELVKLIFDMKMMANQMKQIGYDAKKMPLGKLAKSSISKGYEILKALMEQIKGKNRKQIIRQLSGNFYSQIPHDFGFKPMLNFVLDAESKVKTKLQMLQSIQQIQVFTKLLDEGNVNSNMNELDSNYAKLNIKITPLQKNTPVYQLLLNYVQNTHASTHTAYKIQVQQIFQLQKQSEIQRYRKDINNKQLLWHGSRLTNFVGILSQGLRIAPPEAPVTGYMFGKGVYFADMVTKSGNYCFTSKQNNTGLMLLCQVALGQVNEKFYADYYANLLPEGKFSTKGCGKTAPKQGKMLQDVLVPCGESVSTGINNSSLLYNEFIVYDVAQIKCRYLLKMKFNYK